MTEEQFWSGLGDYQERILNIITKKPMWGL